MADTTVLRPTAHQEDQGASPGFELAALRHEGRVIERGAAVHGEVYGNGLPCAAQAGRGQQRDLGLQAFERGPAELESASADELVRAETDGALLHLLGIGQHGRMRLPGVLHARKENVRGDAGDDVDLRHGHAEGSASVEVAAEEPRHLDLRDVAAELPLHCPRELRDDLVAFGARVDLGKQLLHLRVPADGPEAGLRDGLRTGLPELLLGAVDAASVRPC
mmetsp:Transcript_18538/g.51103  ORF Transcript_18538/g.51103 Transcript_18538/m.51103 type:complete len:221 (-) Transcript_18538:571-1233(-)